MTYTVSTTAWVGAGAALISFVLPSLALFVFLVLTEKDRSKPWLVEFRRQAVAREADMMKDPTRFGLICGAIWIAAIAVFIVLTMKVGLVYSWLAFAAAITVQLLVQAKFFTKAPRA
jgi:hypothetical protein